MKGRGADSAPGRERCGLVVVGGTAGAACCARGAARTLRPPPGTSARIIRSRAANLAADLLTHSRQACWRPRVHNTGIMRCTLVAVALLHLPRPLDKPHCCHSGWRLLKTHASHTSRARACSRTHHPPHITHTHTHTHTVQSARHIYTRVALTWSHWLSRARITSIGQACTRALRPPPCCHRCCPRYLSGTQRSKRLGLA